MSKRISVWSTLGQAVSQTLRRTGSDLGGPVRAMTLSGKRVPEFSVTPKPIILAEKSDAQSLIDGQFTERGQELNTGKTGDPWTIPVPSENFADAVHRFNWIYPLAAQAQARGADGTAKITARRLTDQWIVTYGKWNTFSWQADIVSDRIFALLSTWKILLDSHDEAANVRRRNIGRQCGHLARRYKTTTPGLSRLKAAATLALAGAMMDDTPMLDKNLDRLDEQLELQVLGDGGHVSRSPQTVLNILHILLSLESALEAKGVPGSKQTRRAIDRLGPALMFFTLPDGKLSSFHGGGECTRKAIKTLVKHAKITSKPFSYMPHSGFQRLEKNATVMIFDTGDSPQRPFDTKAHLSPLAFELCAPSGRLIVNCGYSPMQPEKWRSLVRETAAHSTLTIDECSAGDIIDSRFHGPAISRNAGPVKAGSKEIDGDVWMESSHDSYRASTGLTHRRRIYMDTMGVDIRGEDSLAVPIGSAPKFSQSSFPFAIRFHIHPDVRVTLARDLKSALLILPNGEGWRFRTDSGPLKLQKSVYLARGPRPERSEQIVIFGDALSDNDGEDRSNCIRWSFKRLGRVGED